MPWTNPSMKRGTPETIPELDNSARSVVNQPDDARMTHSTRKMNPDHTAKSVGWKCATAILRTLYMPPKCSLLR